MFLTETSFRDHQKPKFLTLSNAYNKHIFINSLFPDENLETIKNVLWTETQNNTLLILSKHAPSVENIKNVTVKNNIMLKTTAKITDFYNNILDNSETISYEITVNPVVTKNGKRIPLSKEETLPWWENKLDTVGLKNIHFAVIDRYYEKVTSKQNFSVLKTQIKGKAFIKNKQLLQEVLYTGVGREKAYGCGLLLIKP